MRLYRNRPRDAWFWATAPEQVLRVVRRRDGRAIARAVTDGRGAYWLEGADVDAVDLTAVKRAINSDARVLRVA